MDLVAMACPVFLVLMSLASELPSGVSYLARDHGAALDIVSTCCKRDRLCSSAHPSSSRAAQLECEGYGSQCRLMLRLDSVYSLFGSAKDLLGSC